MPRSKSVVITGCSTGGIGSALAYAFQKAGLTVVATARTISKIDKKLVELPNVHVVQLDVTNSVSIATAARSIDNLLNGQLDILINNSGIGVPGPIAEIDLQQARTMFDVNFWGVLEISQTLLPIRARKRRQDRHRCIVWTCLSRPELLVPRLQVDT